MFLKVAKQTVINATDNEYQQHQIHWLLWFEHSLCIQKKNQIKTNRLRCYDEFSHFRKLFPSTCTHLITLSLNVVRVMSAISAIHFEESSLSRAVIKKNKLYSKLVYAGMLMLIFIPSAQLLVDISLHQNIFEFCYLYHTIVIKENSAKKGSTPQQW